MPTDQNPTGSSGESWGSPLDRAGEALAMHDTKLDPAMGKIAWRSVHPDVRAAYIERARVVLDAFYAADGAAVERVAERLSHYMPTHATRFVEATAKDALDAARGALR